MKTLSENTIKRVGLRFLKSYYRDRERSGSGKASIRYDVVSDGGIIVDVLLSFKTPEGKPFQAALEATSARTKDEVVYRLQKKLLLWDSLAAASLISALLFSYSYAFKWFSFKELGIPLSILLVLAVMALLAMLIAYAIKWKNRYYYIYAIEQFKKYHVDEQWIAIAEDVFENHEDPKFLELQEQCVLDGFGLVEIKLDQSPHLLITPSRHEIFGKQRQQLVFASDDIAAVPKHRPARWVQTWSQNVSTRFSVPLARQMKRYQLGFSKQIMLTAFSFLLLGTIFHFDLSQSEVAYIDEKVYEKKMLAFSKNTYAEIEEYFLDSAALAPIIAEEPNYLEIIRSREEDTNAENLDWNTGTQDSDEALPLVEIQAVPDKPFKVIITTEQGMQLRYDCQRLYNLHGRYFIVLDNIYTEARKAQKRIARLYSDGIFLNAFSMNCFVEGDLRYLVYYGLFHAEEKDLATALYRYRKLLKQRGFSSKQVRTFAIDIGR